MVKKVVPQLGFRRPPPWEPGHESPGFRRGVEIYFKNEGFDACEESDECMGFLTAFVREVLHTERPSVPFAEKMIRDRMQELIYVDTYLGVGMDEWDYQGQG